MPSKPLQLLSLHRHLLCQALLRLKRNVGYFRTNYGVVMVCVCLVTFLMHPGSLIILGALLAAWIYVQFIRWAGCSGRDRWVSWA